MCIRIERLKRSARTSAVTDVERSVRCGVEREKIPTATLACTATSLWKSIESTLSFRYARGGQRSGGTQKGVGYRGIKGVRWEMRG